MITAAQCRAARALLEWTQRDLMAASSVSLPSIKRFERGNGRTELVNDSLRHAFERARIRFIGRTGLDLPGD